MPHVFKVVGGPEKGKQFELSDGQSFTVGRGRASETRLDDPHMSRVHCRITCKDGVVFIVDLGSSAGTVINGKKIAEETRLPDRCAIKLGGTELHYASGASEEDETLLAPRPDALPRAKLSDLVGKKFGHYSLEKVISKSNTGMVFKGHDKEHGRPVAVKVLAPDLANSDEQRDRFVRAMKVMLPVRNRNIVRLYGAGRKGPYCWAAMEYIDGENLHQVINKIGIEGMLDWKNVWQVAVDVALALVAAEEQGIVHRNVTPTNILRRKDDGSCVLGDFMLAKAMEGTLAYDITRPGELVGDVAYLSPERTRDDMSAADIRSDLYALGATCYALLTGRPPFQSDSLLDLIMKIRSSPPIRPRNYQFSINELFEGLVLKLLEKSPESRCQNARELLKELERVGKYNNLNIRI